MSKPNFANTAKLAMNVTKVKHVVDSHIQQYKKENFIKDYGIELEMSATYTFTALFYRQDLDYLIVINRSIFPEAVTFHNFDTIGTSRDSHEDSFQKEQLELNNCLSIKVYKLINGKYHLVNIRKCDGHYRSKVCISEDGKRFAIVRKGDD